MNAETLKRLETLYDKWCNDPSSPDRDIEIPAEVMDHLPDLIACVKERDQLAEAIKDPAAVWTNMLRGTIARPQALEHYEECKAELEQAKAACSQKDEALQFCSQFPLGEDLHYKVCAALDNNNCGKGYIKAESLKCFKCGDGHTPLYCLNCAREGYHHEREIKPLMEALRPFNLNMGPRSDTDEYPVLVGAIRNAAKALAHWEKEGKA